VSAATGCRHILVMGVSGSGKTTVGTALARAIDGEFLEGDAYHPAANIAKMAAGIPLTDDDREPWLASLATVLADRHAKGITTVLACSALRRAYRDRLRAAVPADESFAILLAAEAPTLEDRLEARRGHYMPASLLASQLATLEPLEPGEAGVTLDAGQPPDGVIIEALGAIGSGVGPPRRM
jgi:gluconokinase